MRNTKEM